MAPRWTKVPYTDRIDGVMPCTKQPELHHQLRLRKRGAAWVSLTSCLAAANARQSTEISLIDTNKDIRPKVTLIKRFSTDIAMCHTPCRLTSTHRRRLRR